MHVKAIKTRALIPPKDDLLEVILSSIKSIEEGSIIAITSKVVSIWQGGCVPVATVKDKDSLIKAEADKYLPRKFVPGAWVMHTLKNNLFIPSAGIDESNANEHYILWPKALKHTVRELWEWFRKKYGVEEVGVVITDSHSIPLRRGTMGISLAHYGFDPLYDYRGKGDIFSRKLKITQKNIADGIAAAAVLVMGEGNESTPLAIVRGVPGVVFRCKPKRPSRPFSSFEIKTKEDIYYPLLSKAPWKIGGGGARRLRR